MPTLEALQDAEYGGSVVGGLGAWSKPLTEQISKSFEDFLTAVEW